jgi:hypothetical protein
MRHFLHGLTLPFAVTALSFSVQLPATPSALVTTTGPTNRSSAGRA